MLFLFEKDFSFRNGLISDCLISKLSPELKIDRTGPVRARGITALYFK